jgi:hypothetical protein
MTNKKNKAGRLDMGGDGEEHHGTDSSRVHGSLEFGVEIEKKIMRQYKHIVAEHLIDESFSIINWSMPLAQLFAKLNTSQPRCYSNALKSAVSLPTR